MLIYRNTIAPDTNKTNNNVMIPYSNCKYGVEVTTNIRDLLINYIFTYIDKNKDGYEFIKDSGSIVIGEDNNIIKVKYQVFLFILLDFYFFYVQLWLFHLNLLA